MGPRTQRRRSGVALAGAVLLAAALAGCAQPGTRVAPRLWSGFVAAVLSECSAMLASAATDDGHVVGIDALRLGWRVRVGDLTVRGDDRGGETWTIGPQTDYVAAGRAIPRFLDCVDRHPLDWSLARADSPVLRTQLYPYLRTQLMPCLGRFGLDPGSIPSARDFMASRRRFDPYPLVPFSGVAEARRIQAACPPAPPSVLAALPAGSGGASAASPPPAETVAVAIGGEAARRDPRRGSTARTRRSPPRPDARAPSHVISAARLAAASAVP